MIYRCIIIEDEKPAQDLLVSYIEKLDIVKLTHIFNNAIEAIGYLRQHQTDLIFLDINMPEMSGIDFLKTLDHPPQVIITTAYSNFAVDGFEFGVRDYLLKPFSFQRFVKAVNRFVDYHNKNNNEKIETITQLKIKADGKTISLSLESILYVEAYGNYLKIYCKQKNYIVRKTLKKLKNELSANFIQVHRSFIIAGDKITSYNSNSIIIGDSKIPLSKVFKNEFLSRMSKI